MYCKSLTKKSRQCSRKVKTGDQCYQHDVFALPECDICYEPRPLVNTKVCEHAFCQDCMSKLTKCAMCRKSLEIAYEDIFPELKRLIGINATLTSANDLLENVCKVFDIIVSPNGQTFCKIPAHATFLSQVKSKYMEFVHHPDFPADRYMIVLTL